MIQPLLLVAALASGFLGWSSPALGQRQTHTVFASVGWSEWCPPGFVQVDLDNGDFKWIAQLPRTQCQNAPSRPFVAGQIARDQLNALREAASRAQQFGLTQPECTEGKPPPHPIISNATPPYMLIVSRPQSSVSAPNDLGCWTKEAVTLQRLLEVIFNLKVRPVGR